MSESFDKAVEAAAKHDYERAWGTELEPWSLVDDLERDAWRAGAAHTIRAALPHLTAQDVPHVIRQAKAEAWGEGYRASETSWEHVYSGHPVLDGEMCPECCQSNPYAEEADHEHRT